MRNKLSLLFLALTILTCDACQAFVEKWPQSPELENAAALLADGDTQKAIDIILSVTLRTSADADIVTLLHALTMMAEAYEKEGDVEKELLCYQQIFAMNWANNIPTTGRRKIISRIVSIGDLIRDDKSNLANEKVLKWSAIAIPLLENVSIGLGPPTDVILKIRLRRATALAETNKLEEGRQELIAAATTVTPTDNAGWLIEKRYKALWNYAAWAPPESWTEAESKILELRQKTNDDVFAILCAAVLARMAIETQDWPAAIARTKTFFYICPCDHFYPMILKELSDGIAPLGKEAGLSDAAITGLSRFSEIAANGNKSKSMWYINACFPIKELAGKIPPQEAEILTQEMDGLANAKDTKNLRRKARLHLCLDEPAKALKTAYDAYMAAEPGREEQFAAAAEFVNAAKAGAGKILTPVPFYAYAAFGPEGPDGRPNTPDDLQNPFLPFLAK